MGFYCDDVFQELFQDVFQKVFQDVFQDVFQQIVREVFQAFTSVGWMAENLETLMP